MLRTTSPTQHSPVDLIQQEYRAGLVDVERGRSDRADALSRLEPDGGGPVTPAR